MPALSGLSCPYWDRNAAGMWLGLGADTTKKLTRVVKTEAICDNE